MPYTVHRRSGIWVGPSPLLQVLISSSLLLGSIPLPQVLYFSPVSYNTHLLQSLFLLLCLLMQAFLRRFFCLPKKPSSSRKSFSTSHRMSSSGTAASLYAATISPASVAGAEPEEAKDKRHHLKDGKGFTNPWVCAEPLIAGYELYLLVPLTL